MSAIQLSTEEKNVWRIVQAVRQLVEGRNNATGIVTLRAGQVTTVVPAQNCGMGSAVFLFPRTANAAAKVATTYVKDADVIKGQFVVTHANSADADQSFYWIATG